MPGKDEITHPRSHRVTSAPAKFIRVKPINPPVDVATIKSIKKSASEAWKLQIRKEKESVTTYNGFHVPKCLDEPTQNRVRSSSKCRINKPHPPTVFLVTRLNEIEGCFEPKEAASKRYGGEAKRNLDKYVFEHRHQIKRSLKAKPLQRPNTCFETSSRGDVRMQTIVGKVPGHLTKTWTKDPTDRANERLRSFLKVLQKSGSDRPRIIQQDGRAYQLVNLNPCKAMQTTASKQPFYDFQIHPEWHMPWHKRYERLSYL